MIYVFSEHKDNSAFGRMAPTETRPHDEKSAEMCRDAIVGSKIPLQLGGQPNHHWMAQ